MYSPSADFSQVTDVRAVVPRSDLGPEEKYLSHTLRLSNNNLPNLVCLQDVMSHFRAQPSRLGWLDLSFNKITRWKHVISALPLLKKMDLSAVTCDERVLHHPCNNRGKNTKKSLQ